MIMTTEEKIIDVSVKKCPECGASLNIVEYRRQKTLKEGAIIGGVFLKPTPEEEAISKNIIGLNTIKKYRYKCPECNWNRDIGDVI